MEKSFIRKYSDYINNNPKGYWFKRKIYGWGWIPATKEGLAIILIFIVLLFVIGYDFALNGQYSNKGILLFYIKIVVLVLLLVFICYRTGEKPKWSWGFSKK